MRYEEYQRTSRFASLDGLRCLSILPVIWHHATPRPLEGILGRGPFGVDLFFAISGFLITTLLLREGTSKGSISLSRFYLRRTLRIFPLYYAVLGLYVLRGWLFLPDAPLRAHFFSSLPFYSTYTSNWFVDFNVPHPIVFGFSWSLAVEEQFYLVWPWFLRGRRSWAHWHFPALFMLAALALDYSAEHAWLAPWIAPEGLAHRMMTSIATPICLGSLLGYALHFRKSFSAANTILGRRCSAPIFLLALAALLATDGTPLFLIHIVMAMLVAAVCLRGDHGLAKLLNIPILRLVGVVSYGMYLFHVSVITGMKLLLPDAWRTAPILFVLASCITFALAWTSYRFFEMPFLKLKNRFQM